MGGFVYVGLDYAAVPSVLWGLEIKAANRREVFAGIRIMESAALPFLNAQPEGPERETATE